MEDVVHEVLEGSGSVGKSHRENEEFEGAIASTKCSFPLFSRSHLDVVVAVPEVDLGEVFSALQAVKKVIDARKRIPVFTSDVVQSPVVDTKAESSIFLLANRMGAPAGDEDGQMKPLARFSSRKSLRAFSSISESL